jgi:hypothetical protein
MADLRKQLEKVVRDGHDADGTPPLAAALHRKRARGLRVWVDDRDLGDEDPSPPPRPRSRSPSPLKDKDKAAVPSLAARYDFGASLKSPAWTPPPPQVLAPSTSKPKTTRPRVKSPPAPAASTSTLQFPGAGEHRRSMTIPVDGTFTFSPRVPRPCGSPRDSADYADEGAGEHHCLSRREGEEDNRSRHHTRGWTHRSSYFDRVAEDAPGLKKTPPSTPTVTAATPTPPGSGFRLSMTSTTSSSSTSSSSSSRSSSVSPTGSRLALDAVWGTLQPGENESIASTPSITTSASSPSMSPLSPPEYLPRAGSDENVAIGAIAGMSRAKRPPVDSTPYHSFLDQFVCRSSTFLTRQLIVLDLKGSASSPA